MRYLVRALKYFVQITVLMTVVIFVLMFAGVISKDINVAFQQGWKSVGYILGMFAAVAAVYPHFGYTSRSVAMPGETAELREGLLATLRERGYELEKEEGDTLCFRLRSGSARFARLWEDRLTFKRELGGYRVEGLNKDLVRVAGALEYRFRNPDTPSS